MRPGVVPVIFAASLFPLSTAFATPYPLQNATATYSQAGFEVGEAINGLPLTEDDGWSVGSAATPDPTEPQIAVFETVASLTAPQIDLTLLQNQVPSVGDPGNWLIGRFRFSVTADDRDSFADGLSSGGDVDANWTVLTPLAIEDLDGMTSTVLPDGSVLTGGVIPLVGTYSVRYDLPFGDITGFRLEVLSHDALPFGGPGHNPTDGNFVLSEIKIVVLPEPATIGLMLVGGALAAACRRRAGRIGSSPTPS